MNEQSYDNMSTANSDEATKLDDEFIPADAKPICCKCLKPCHPLQYYCDNCDSNQAINPLAPYIGFVNIRFNYDIFLTMWRKIWFEKNASIMFRLLCLFVIIIYAPVILIFGLPFLLIGKIRNLRQQRTAETVFYIILAVLLWAYLFYMVS